MIRCLMKPEKFEALSQSGKRFSLFALTVDTHHPDGFISRTCQRKAMIWTVKEPLFQRRFL